MMTKYIDREALREQLFSYYACVNEDTSKSIYKGETLMAYEVADMINDCLDNAPVVDVAPAVHGRWEQREDAPGFVRCSHCRDCNVYDEWLDGKKWAYCPHCGAKMDCDN